MMLTWPTGRPGSLVLQLSRAVLDMNFKTILLWMTVTALSALMAIPAKAEPIELEKIRTIQDIVIDPGNPSGLLLATTTGLYHTTRGKRAELLSLDNNNLISLAVSNDNTLYASGHPPVGGNLGVLRSRDRGRTWERVSVSPDGPMAVEHLAVSESAAETIYGVYQGLRASHDGGRTWLKVAAEPPGLYGLEVSRRDPNILYAATRNGLFVSNDGGKSWNDPHQLHLPVTMTRSAGGDMLYAYVAGKGLLGTPETAAAWKPVYNQFGNQVISEMVVAPGNPGELIALNQFSRLLKSSDGGASWHRFVGDPAPATDAQRHGEKLFGLHCQACHGPLGVGENYTRESMSDRSYLIAPALDDSTHAWHHSDDDLVKTILEGSPRTERMQAWKTTLSEQDARDIVAFMKSLWGQRALDCQGPKHMQCM